MSIEEHFAESKKAHPSTGKAGKMPIPVNPVIYASLRAIYAGGPGCRWKSDSYGRPYYPYQARDGQINIYFDPPYPPHQGYLPWSSRDMEKAAELQKLYLTPRWQNIYTGSIREAVRNLSVETADVFLILMAEISRLPDPRRDTAFISMEDIAAYRSVRIRHGSATNLHREFKEEILRLADLRLTMTWRDYKRGGTLFFGRERPDRLLDVVDVEYRRDDTQWASVNIRCGQALAGFLNPDGLRWVGYYSRALLQLNPYQEAVAKKMGTYWIMIGVTAGKRGERPRATPYTILDFCGEKINWRNPGQTVDSFIKAHERLREIGILEETPVLEPPDRNKGYFKKWLQTPLSVKLSDNLWMIKVKPDKKALTASDNTRQRNRTPLHCRLPGNATELQNDPHLIRQFRSVFGIHQEELAHTVGVARQTLSNYERCRRQLPYDVAVQILSVWKRKSRQYDNQPIK
ncbi:MAG: hypothetical protein VR67_04615 [Peptococcaceae bacterium BRH_c8a]|nr:MAG: hypothetical protein VR67_04615 [Peptococcaceae bacterium BRH_c8a]